MIVVINEVISRIAVLCSRTPIAVSHGNITLPPHRVASVINEVRQDSSRLPFHW